VTEPGPLPTGPSLAPGEAERLVRVADAADRLEALADRIERALDDVDAFDRPDVWRGARSERFAEQRRRQASLLAHRADALRAAGRVARSRVDARRAELAHWQATAAASCPWPG
jgi:hypothetical protein